MSTGVVGSVNHGLARRDGGGHAVPGEAGAHSENHVGSAQEAVQRAAHHAGAAAQRKWMLFRKRALARHRGHHRRLKQLGKLHQLRRGVRVQGTLPRMNHRAAGVQQDPRRALDVLFVRRGPSGSHRTVAFEYGGLDFGDCDVRRNLQHHRAGAAHAHRGERAPHGVYDAARRVQQLHALGDRLVAAHRAEEREYAVTLRGMAQRQQQHRHRV